MDNYIINEFMNLDSQREPKKAVIKNDADSRRRAKAIEIFEQSNGFIGPEEIADILEIDIKRVEGYLGKTRIQRYERIKAGEDIVVGDKKQTKGKKSRTPQVSNTSVDKAEKLTQGKVKKLAIERNFRIIAMHEEGLSMEEIASKEKLTPDQLKEIFLALGLSIYTREELLEMQRQEAEERKSREEAERLERTRKRKREWIRNKRARIREEKERQRRKQEGAEQEAVIRNYSDIRRKMRELISQRNSKGAIEFAERYLDDPNFLTKEERSELLILVKYISEAKRSYQEQHQNHENIKGHETPGER